jgi:hypothetical protein
VILLGAQPFAPAFAGLFANGATIDPNYRDGLAGYAAWRSSSLGLPQRYAALAFACRVLLAVCREAATLARLSTLARATWEAGQRAVCVAALRTFAERVARGDMALTEPFWPASARFDEIAPGAKRAEWLLVSAFEQFERAATYSSQFGAPAFDLDWLCAQPFAPAEMDRRRILRRVRAGERMEVPARLCVPAEDHLNADIWRAGLVPGTVVRKAADAG